MIQLDERLGGQPRYFATKEPRKLMLVPEHVRDCVIFVGHKLNSGGWEYAGTVFLIGRPIEGTNNREHATYCVTAKHVIDGIKERGGYKVINGLNGQHRRIAFTGRFLGKPALPFILTKCRRLKAKSVPRGQHALGGGRRQTKRFQLD